MGATYGNISVRGPTISEIAGWLRSKGLNAFIGELRGDWVTFSDERSDMMLFEDVLSSITAELQCVGIAIALYDEELLTVLVAKDGQLESRFRSCPGMEMEDPSDEDMAPHIEDAPALVAALEPKTISVDELLKVLKVVDKPVYVDPMDLHEEILGFLDLPKYGFGFGYRYTIQDGLDSVESQLTRVEA